MIVFIEKIKGVPKNIIDWLHLQTWAMENKRRKELLNDCLKKNKKSIDFLTLIISYKTSFLQMYSENSSENSEKYFKIKMIIEIVSDTKFPI